MLILLAVVALLWPQPAAPRRARVPDIEVIQFAGAVTRGQLFERPIGRKLVFQLDPNDEGWSLSVVIKQRPEDDHREACEPLHGGSQCDFAGEYFLPDSKAWDYLKSRTRTFQIGLGRMKQPTAAERKENPQWWRRPEYEAWGTGTFIIEDVTVGVGKNADECWIDSMTFRVELRLPR
jgi:hypothetical protein